MATNKNETVTIYRASPTGCPVFLSKTDAVAGQNHGKVRIFAPDYSHLDKVKEDIKHTGLIFDIVGGRIDVAVTPESACASCKAAAMCFISDKEEKVVSVVTEHPEIYKVGEQVEVSVGRAMGVKAVVLAYVVPFVVLMAALVGLLTAGTGEVAAGLMSLGTVGIYYICLYFFRKHIESEIIFKINKI